MAFQVKLTRGNTSLDLTATPYAVGNDFAPPALSMAYNVSSGTSANQTGGGSLIGSRANNRQWAFTVRILASNLNDATGDVRKLASFIKQQSSDTLYLNYRDNADFPVPLWGQFGAPLRLEVVTCDVGAITDAYLRGSGKGFFITVSMEVKPYAIGYKQSLVNAKGIVMEDTLGRTDGLSGGFQVCPIGFATVNFFTNPIHGSGTYSTGWTTGASLTASQNLDMNFVLFGLCSVKLSQNANVDASYSQSTTTGSATSHTLSCYVKKQDSSAITTADVKLFYNGAVTASTTFDAVGNGWYRAYSVITALVGAATAGLALQAIGTTIYATGFQFERQYYSRPLPLVHGDMLGCAWSGTAHASTTTGAAGVVYGRTADLFNIAQGTICIVWKADNASASKTTAVWMFQDNTIGFRGGWDGTTGKWFFNDGTNALLSSADTYAAGDRIVLHFVWGPSQLTIYKNGVSIGTTANYKASNPGTNFYIGTDNAGANACVGPFIGFTTYAQAFTAAQVTSQYNAVSPVVSSLNKVDSVPWFWVKDGDGQVDNCDDSTRDNWAVAHGIPGNLPADTTFDLSYSTALKNFTNLYISNAHTQNFVNPSNNYNLDYSGTADGSASGGAFAQDTSITNNVTVQFTAPGFLSVTGKEFYMYVRCKDATGTGLTATLQFNAGGGVSISSPSWTFTPSTTLFTTMFTPYSIVIPDIGSKALQGGLTIATPLANFRVDRGGSNTLSEDYGQIMFRPLMRLNSSISNGIGSVINGANILEYTAPAVLYNGNMSMTGDIIELYPGKYNELLSVMGSPTITQDITWTLTYKITITPRYALV